MRAMSTPGYAYAFLSTLTIGFLSSALLLPAIAQVTSDGTQNTSVNPNGNNFTIINGIEKGNNLFHSFSNFSVPTGGSASFDLTNTPNIITIFSRITGGNVSNIDGLIRTLNSSNPVSLFLMNPHGIVFGQNARLDISGSFVATTANSIKFADGIEFSAQSSQGNSLLTISVPIGLQMGSNPGAISVQGKGHGLAQPSFFSPIIQQNSTTGLRVSPGNTLALIGSAIALDGGVLLAPSGHVELGSLSNGSVGINTGFPRWNFDYGNVQQFADIRLSQQALVDASGTPAGSLHLQGRNISLLQGSVARLQNLGGTALGNLVINASGLLEMRQVGSYGFPNNLLSVENLGTGTDSNLIVSAQQLQVQDGGVITTKTFSTGAGGNISIKVLDSIDLNGWSAINPTVATAIGAATLAHGPGGNLTIASKQFRLANGAAILNLTAGTGLSGNIALNATERIEVSGENPIIYRTSAISTTTLNQGDGGNLIVTAPQIMMLDGGGIGTSTLASGNSGDITISASDGITINGIAPASAQPSRIVARAELLPEIQRQSYGLPSFPTGNAGALVLNTSRLQVNDRAIIGVDNQGIGNAGNLQIKADQVILNHQGMITAATESGEGGNITLNIKELLSLRHNSAITTTAKGIGNGGNTTINAPIIVGLENSDIIANALTGNGGNINIKTQGIFGLKYRNQLPTENDITASSQFGINGTVDINNFGVDPNSGLVQLPANITDPSQQIATGCSNNTGSSFVVTGRGGIPQNPSQQLTSDVYNGLRLRTWSDVRDISAYRKTQKVQAQIPESPEVLVQATSWHRNAQGKIELVADKSPTQVQQPLTCAGISR
ncbi:S-layer family protein [Nostoc sp.]|uniref:S-layer family protein n=1 Tax=Nostoc sp. TaxID=1180 RepID=UPI002FF47A97